MLRYAIVGTNWLSHIYYHAIEAAGDRVAAVCSRSRERAAELGQGKALVYTELDEMLKNPDIDVVYLCIPNVLHADAALRCLRAGKHVLCEKPGTVSAAEMEEILHTARTEGRIFAEAVMNFYSPVTDRLRAGAGAGFGSLRPSGLQPALQQAGPLRAGEAHHEL